MTAADDIAELRRQVADQQRQIVEMRAGIANWEDRQAALLKHWVESEVTGHIQDRLPTKEESQHLTAIFKAAIERAKQRSELMTHMIKWGAGGVVAFFLVAAWDWIKEHIGAPRTSGP